MYEREVPMKVVVNQLMTPRQSQIGNPHLKILGKAYQHSGHHSGLRLRLLYLLWSSDNNTELNDLGPVNFGRHCLST